MASSSASVSVALTIPNPFQTSCLNLGHVVYQYSPKDFHQSLSISARKTQTRAERSIYSLRYATHPFRPKPNSQSDLGKLEYLYSLKIFIDRFRGGRSVGFRMWIEFIKLYNNLNFSLAFFNIKTNTLKRQKQETISYWLVNAPEPMLGRIIVVISLISVFLSFPISLRTLAPRWCVMANQKL